MAAGSQESSEQQPAAVERQARLRLDLFSYPRYKPPYDNSQHGDTNKRMGNTTMVFQVGDTILQTGKDVDVRSVGGQNQRQRGETCLTVQPRLADGDRGQGVGNVIHGKTRSQKSGVRSQESEYGRRYTAYGRGNLPAAELRPGFSRRGRSEIPITRPPYTVFRLPYTVYRILTSDSCLLTPALWHQHG